MNLSVLLAVVLASAVGVAAPAHAELLVSLDGPAHVVVTPGAYVEQGASCIENGVVTGRATVGGNTVGDQPRLYLVGYTCRSGDTSASLERIVTVIPGGGVEGLSGTAASCGTSRSQLCVPTDIPRCDLNNRFAEGRVAYADGLEVTRLPGGYLWIEHEPDSVLPSYYEVRSSMTGRSAQVFNYEYELDPNEPDAMVAVPPALVNDISDDPVADSFTARAVYMRSSSNYGDSSFIRVIPNAGITFEEYKEFDSFRGPAALRTDGSEYIVDIVNGEKTVITDTRYFVNPRKSQCVLSEDGTYKLEPPAFKRGDITRFALSTHVTSTGRVGWEVGDPFPVETCVDDHDGEFPAVAGPFIKKPGTSGFGALDDVLQYTCTDSHGNTVSSFVEVGFELAIQIRHEWDVPNPIRLVVGTPLELPPITCLRGDGQIQPIFIDTNGVTINGGYVRNINVYTAVKPALTPFVVIDDPADTTVWLNATHPGSSTIDVACDYLQSRNIKSRPVVAHIDDGKPPVMGLHGYETMRHVRGEPFRDPVASCVDGTTGPEPVSSSGLDDSTTGTHVVRYTCADFAGNAAEVSRDVVVADSFEPDTTPPKLELVNATDTVPQWSRYEGGATCTDDVNGQIYHVSESVKIGGSFAPRNITDTTMPGTYEITYSCTDQAGNTGTISRTVTVTAAAKPAEDAERPLARLDGAPSISVLPGERFPDPGATCVSDAGVEAAPAITPDTTASGTRDVAYVCGTGESTDTVYRTINVVDRAAAFPDIVYLHGYERAHHRTGAVYTDPGATCIGRLDEPRVASAEGEVDDAVPGRYEITYTCPLGDRSATRTVTVSDTKPADFDPPVLRLNGDRLVDIRQYRPYHDAGATCTDRQDGALRPLVQVQYTGSTGARAFATHEVVDPTTPGTYTIRYTCTDSAGNAARGITERLVRVEPAERPAADLGRPAIWLVAGTGVDAVAPGETGEPYRDFGAKCSDDRDGVYDARAAGAVNTNLPGAYLRSYTCTDEAGNAPATAARSVVVPPSDTGMPEITIRGFSRVLHTLGEPYADRSASCIDPEEGVLPVTTRGNVTTGTAGTYSIEYSCGDSADNRASESRTVIVAQSFAADTVPPAITPGGTMAVTQNYRWDDGVPPLSPPPTCTDATSRDISHVTTHTFVYTGSFFKLLHEEDYLVPNMNRHLDYVLVHTCTDQAGNTATISVYVNHLQGSREDGGRNSPSMILRGEDSILHPIGEPFADPGASCADEGDGLIRVEGRSSVDDENLGLYGVEYSCTDKHGSTVYAHRVVRVVPADRPVAILNGEEDVTHRTASLPGQEGYYEDPGATCTFPSGASSRETSRSSVPPFDGTARGAYVVTYTCTSAEGSDSVSRTIRVSDGLPPVITLVGNMTYPAARGVPFEDPGASCNDISDGVIEEITSNPEVVDVIEFGNYTIDYSCTDSDGNTGTAVRHVIVGDGTPPLITLRGPASVRVQTGSTYADPGASCTDDVDDPRDAMVSGAHGAELGPYTILYTCTDAAGNSAVPATRLVTVVGDGFAPEVVRRGPATVQHVLRQPYQDAGARCVDTMDGEFDPVTSGLDMVDVNTAGTYKVNYTCEDVAGNSASKTRLVDVRASHPADVVPPLVSVTGDDPLVHAAGLPFEDPGAACEDDPGGVIDEVDAVVAGPGGRTSVDVDHVAEYVITYDCADASGNRASDDRRAANTRTVQVADPPVITLRGLAVTQLPQGQTFADVINGRVVGAACSNAFGALPVTVNGTIDGDTAGRYERVYSCVDGAGQGTRVIRVVLVLDITIPDLDIGDKRKVAFLGDPFDVLDGVTCIDNLDGEITPVADPATVPTDTARSTDITYTCTDEAGNFATDFVRVVVRPRDNVKPVIDTNNPPVLSVVANTTFVANDPTCTDDVDGPLRVVPGGDTVDITRLGEYTITYDCTDTSGNQADQRTLVVRVVRDGVAPVITINGSSVVIVGEFVTGAADNPQQGDAALYVDEGAACVDATDGRLEVTPVRTVHSWVRLITYSCTDEAGNTATAQRYVIADFDPIVRSPLGAGVTEPIIRIGNLVEHVPADSPFVDTSISCTTGSHRFQDFVVGHQRFDPLDITASGYLLSADVRFYPNGDRDVRVIGGHMT
ncbi:MAG: DUF5011 domain-containing protein, partial [Nitrosopumilus sp.]|nr:DUF5011 domain-containing protein [Nitrosopumilus sp.]